VVKTLALKMATVIGTGIAAVAIDRIFQFSELLVHRTVSYLHYAGDLSVALPAWDGLPDTAWWLR